MLLKKKKVNTISEDNILVKLQHDPSEADNKVDEIEDFWGALSGLKEEKKSLFKKAEIPTYSLEIFSDKEGASFFFSIPKRYKNVISKKLNAVYPYIELIDVPAAEDYLKTFKEENSHIESHELVLTEDQTNLLKTKGVHKFFLNGLINSMNHFDEEESSLIQIIIKPMPDRSRRQGQLNLKKSKVKNIYVRALLYLLGIVITSLAYAVSFGRIGFNKTITKQSENKNDDKAKDEKFDKPCFNVSIRVASKSNDEVIARENAKGIATAFTALDNKHQQLRPIKINFSSIEDRELIKMNTVLNSTEMSQFAHLPGPKVQADSIQKSSIKMPYDKNIPKRGLVFGESNGNPIAFPMVPISVEKYKEILSQKEQEIEKIIDNICKPRLVLGQMGTGKSEWIINYAIKLAEMGVSLIVVDPKNDTQQRLIESLPDHLMKKVDYIDLGDLTFPPAMNLMRKRKDNDPTEVSMIVTSLINFFKKEFGKSWGFAMQQLIQMTGNAILLDEVSTMYEFQLMLNNKEYRAGLIGKMEKMLEDPETKSKAMLKELLYFWKQYHSMKPKEQRGMISSTMNKVGVFMGNRLIRAIVSQRESYDFRKAGDQGRITIINIPEGILTPENSRLLASFINKAVWLDFQSRADTALQDRYPTVWLIEEAHMVMDEEFLGVLTKSRGYRLGLTVITQGLTNFDGAGSKELKELILTNCKNKIMFRLGHADARAMSDEMAPLTTFDMMNIPDYHFYGKVLLQGGKVSDAFFAKALMPAEPVRSYDEFKLKHKSGKMTIDEIEDDLDSRHSIAGQMGIFNMASDDEEDDDEIEKDTTNVKDVKKLIAASIDNLD